MDLKSFCRGPTSQLMNLYIPKMPEKKKREQYDHDLLTYFEDLKYEESIENMDSHFANAKVINLDIIHHECQGDKLNNPREYYQTIKNLVLKITKMTFANEPCRPL